MLWWLWCWQKPKRFFRSRCSEAAWVRTAMCRMDFGFERVYGWQNVPIDDARPIHAIISTCSTYGPGRLEFIFPGHWWYPYVICWHIAKLRAFFCFSLQHMSIWPRLIQRSKMYRWQYADLRSGLKWAWEEISRRWALPVVAQTFQTGAFATIHCCMKMCENCKECKEMIYKEYIELIYKLHVKLSNPFWADET